MFRGEAVHTNSIIFGLTLLVLQTHNLQHFRRTS